MMDMKIKFALLMSTGLLAFQSHAELIINGQPIQTSHLYSSASPLMISQDPFKQCLAQLRTQAEKKGISLHTFDRYTQNLQPDYSVISKLNDQPEFSIPVWDYLSGLVDQERIAMGQQKIAQHQDVLKRVSERYGVPAETIVAVWGVESNFGDISGKYSLLQALSTLSCEGRRQSFYRGEFFATLRILQRGDLQPQQLYGSWAGAFGHTQFMPTTYEELAVDFDGDGRRDLVSSIPDALASTANFLKRRGWQTGQTWGYEVNLPIDMSINGESRRNKKALSTWISRGVTRVDGRPMIEQGLTEYSQAGLIAPAGRQGPIFLVFKNFDVIYSYNAAETYALAIAHLSDRLTGKDGFKTSWPTDDAGTSRAERREIQQRLIARGHDIGTVDGLIGEKSRQAIRYEQQRLGLKIDGRAGQAILRALRQF